VGRGESPRESLASVQATESTCIEPGQTIANDPNGDQGATGSTQQDIEKVSIAEPWFGAGVRKLVFTMKVQNLGADPLTLTPNSLWTILWTHPNGGSFPVKFVQMNTCDATALPTFAYGHVEGVGPSRSSRRSTVGRPALGGRGEISNRTG